MIIWLAMLIPLIGGIIAFYYFQKEFVWWEVLVPTLVCFLIITCFKYGVEAARTVDTQYKGGLVVEARYYEYWSTWLHLTCTKQVPDGETCTGSGNSRSCTTKYRTEYYDCSRCDENDEYWEAIDNQGHSWHITEAYYNQLKARWHATPTFVDMQRDITKHWDCGVDGDAYSIKWNNDPLTSEPSTVTESYNNKIQAAKSSFDMKVVTHKEALKYHLYEYPSITDKYHQATILGIDSFPFIQGQAKDSAIKLFNYFNGLNGPLRKLRLYVLLFSGQNLSIASKQRDYWDGGNKNEVVICIDVERQTGKINWVQAFSWSANKRVAVDLREDISNLDTLNFVKMYPIVDASTKNYICRNFDDFNYLNLDVPTWEVWVVYILTLLVTIGLLYYGYINEFEQEDNRPLYTK